MPACETNESATVVRPGQLYIWQFSVSGGFWMFTRVTEEGRNNPWTVNHVIARQGMPLLMLRPDDPGPAEAPEYDTLNGIPYYPSHRWHVMLVEGVMVWVRHDWLEQAELVEDVV